MLGSEAEVMNDPKDKIPIIFDSPGNHYFQANAELHTGPLPTATEEEIQERAIEITLRPVERFMADALHKHHGFPGEEADDMW